MACLGFRGLPGRLFVQIDFADRLFQRVLDDTDSKSTVKPLQDICLSIFQLNRQEP